MKNSIFGDVFFDTGWKTKEDIIFFNKNYIVVVKAKSYRKEDDITPQQEKAFSNFKANKADLLKDAEQILGNFSAGNASERFTPRTLLIQRNGDYALLLDDNEDEDDGIAVCLAPKISVLSQDEYL